METLEQKKERLRPIFERSQEVFRNPDHSLREGALLVTQRLGGGEALLVPNVVAMEIDDGAVELGVIEGDGEIGPSGFIDWENIIDAKENTSS